MSELNSKNIRFFADFLNKLDVEAGKKKIISRYLYPTLQENHVQMKLTEKIIILFQTMNLKD